MSKLGHPFTSGSPQSGSAISRSTGMYSLASMKFTQELCSTPGMLKWRFVTALALTQLKRVKLPRVSAKPEEAVFLFKLLSGEEKERKKETVLVLKQLPGHL